MRTIRHHLTDVSIPNKDDLIPIIKEFSETHGIEAPKPYWGLLQASDFESIEDYYDEVSSSIDRALQIYGRDINEGKLPKYCVELMQPYKPRQFATLAFEGAAGLTAMNVWNVVEYEGANIVIALTWPHEYEETLRLFEDWFYEVSAEFD